MGSAHLKAKLNRQRTGCWTVVVIFGGLLQSRASDEKVGLGCLNPGFLYMPCVRGMSAFEVGMGFEGKSRLAIVEPEK